MRWSGGLVLLLDASPSRPLIGRFDRPSQHNPLSAHPTMASIHRLCPPFLTTLALSAALSTLMAGTLATAPASAAHPGTPGTQSGSGSGADDRKESDRERRERERAEKDAAKDRAKRLDKLDRVDRAAVDRTLDFAMPTWTAGMEWVGEAKAPSIDDLRGRVVVIQTFSTKNAQSRSQLDRLAKALAEFKPEDVRLIAVHTPEGADRAVQMLEKNGVDFPVAIDANGEFCDAIGAFRKPVNIVVNRTGDVKHAGLTTDGVAASVRELVAETFDPAVRPNARKPETSKSPKDFPLFTNALPSSLDLRGKPAPGIGNVDWWNFAPDIKGKLVVVDFWATWCKPCKDAIPHMNELVRAFPNDVQAMGISNESNSKFERGLVDSRLNKSDFAYPVGVDPNGAMQKGFGVRGIPHVAAISSDGIVRWQGHPNDLTRDVMRQLVEANRALLSHQADTDYARWKQALATERDGGRRR
jgi:thiol-disulfide isomerase/thioredoxin